MKQPQPGLLFPRWEQISCLRLDGAHACELGRSGQHGDTGAPPARPDVSRLCGVPSSPGLRGRRSLPPLHLAGGGEAPLQRAPGRLRVGGWRSCGGSQRVPFLAGGGGGYRYPLSCLSLTSPH